VTEELCGRLGIPFREERLSPSDCYEADEVLLTSTPCCLAPVRAVDGHLLPWPGQLFERLVGAWNDVVGLDLRRQILSNP
jgi:branched-subunit amino acid aminotransferase/4-amino-4-deoxychorismate lyase